MTNKEIVLNAMRSQGKADALSLRNRAPDMEGTALIAEQEKIPAFDTKKNYLEWQKGCPVTDEDQVWILIQPYNAANHAEHKPSTLRAHWGLTHTKDPYKAKPWVDAFGDSGMYMKDECYLAENGKVYRSKQDNLVYKADALPSAWEEVIM